MSDLQQIFLEEATDLFEEIEEDMILLEESLDTNAVNPVFRNIHTIKGGAGMAQLSGLSKYAHHLENLLSRIQSGEVVVSSVLVSVMLEGLDILRQFAAAAETGDMEGRSVDPTLIEGSLEKIRTLCTECGSVAAAPVDPHAPAVDTTTARESADIRPVTAPQISENYLLQLRFSDTFMAKGGDATELLKAFKLNNYGLKVHRLLRRTESPPPYSRIMFPVSPFDGSL